MANITVEKGPEERATLSRHEAWDPFRAMRELLQWDPLRHGHGLLQREFEPAFEVKETEGAYEFRADLPGVDPKDLDVKFTNNRLVITGKREAEHTQKGETYYTFERSFGTFTRSFTVPEGIDADAINAELKDGVLKLVLPKKPESKPREIKVKNA